jgi:hypothetical protein
MNFPCSARPRRVNSDGRSMLYWLEMVLVEWLLIGLVSGALGGGADRHGMMRG